MEEGLRAAVGASCHGAMQHVDGLVEQSRAGLVVGQVEGRLAAAGERPAVPVEEGLLVEGPDIERVGSEHGRHVDPRRLELAGAAQQRCLEAQRCRLLRRWPRGPARANARARGTSPLSAAISARAVSAADAKAPSQPALPKASSAAARSPRSRRTRPSR